MSSSARVGLSGRFQQPAAACSRCCCIWNWTGSSRGGAPPASATSALPTLFLQSAHPSSSSSPPEINFCAADIFNFNVTANPGITDFRLIDWMPLYEVCVTNHLHWTLHNIFCLQGNEGLLSAKNHMKDLWSNWNHHPRLHNILIQHYRLKNAGEIFPCQYDLSLEGIELLNPVIWSFSLLLLPNILVTGTDLTCFYPCPALLIVKSDLPVWQPGAFCVHDMAALLIVDLYHYIWGLVAMVGGFFPWISNELGWLGAWIEGLSCKSVQFWEWFSCLATHHIIPVLRRQRVG